MKGRTCATGRERQALDALLAHGPLSPAAVAARTGASLKCVYRTLSALRQKGHAFAEGRPAAAPRRGKGHAGTVWYAIRWWLEHNSGLMFRVAHKVAAFNRHVELNEILSELHLCALRAVRTFRPKGFKFSSYALRFAERAVKGWCVTQRRRGVYVPAQHRFDPTVGPVVVSLGPCDRESGGDCPLLPAAPEPDRGPPMDPAIWAKAVSRLGRRSALVVLALYRDQRTLASVGAELSLSKERVRQIAAAALDAIRAGGALGEYAA